MLSYDNSNHLYYKYYYQYKKENINVTSAATKSTGLGIYTTWGTTYSNRFYGYMDEVGVWNRSLNGSDIVDLWNLGNGLEYSAGENIRINLAAPIDGAFLNSLSPQLNFSFDSNNQFANCTLFINGSMYGTNDTVYRDVITTFVPNATLGYNNLYNWYVNCTVNVTSNISVNRSFRVVSLYVSEYNVTPQSAYATSELNCSFNVSSMFNTTLNVSGTWFMNGTRNTSWDYNWVVANNSLSVTTLGNGSVSAGNATRGQVWMCGLNITDGTSARWVNTSSVTILNSLPSAASNLAFNKDVFSVGGSWRVVNNTPLLNWTNGTDLDGDAVWSYVYITNVSAGGVGSLDNFTEGNFTEIGNVVPLVDGYNYSVTVVSFDGFANSSTYSILNFSMNAPPVVVELNLSPSVFYRDDNVSCNVVSSDADGDSIVVNYSWFNNSVLLGELSNNLNLSNLSLGSNVTCQVTLNDSFELTVQNVSANVSVHAPVFAGLGGNESVKMFMSFTLVANITDLDGQVGGVNFSVQLPSGVLDSFSSTLVGGVWVSNESLVATNGTYVVNATTEAGLNATTNIVVTDYFSVNPTDYVSVSEAGVNFSIPFGVLEDSVENLSYNVSFNLTNASYYNVSFNATWLEGNGTIQVEIQPNSTMPDGTYYGTLNFTRVIDNRSLKVNLTLSIGTNFGKPYVTNKTDISVSILSTASVTRSFNVSNYGSGNLSACVPSLAGDFVGWSFVHWNNTGFGVLSGGWVNLSLTFALPPASTYRGYMHVICQVTNGGLTSDLNVSNQPYLQLVSTAPSGDGGGGGGGGGGSTVIVVQGGGNESIFSVKTDADTMSSTLLMYPNQMRELLFVVENLQTTDLALTVGCKGDFCSNVEFSDVSLDLAGGQKKFVVMNLTYPASASYDSAYSFEVEISDAESHSAIITYSLEASRLSAWWAKFALNVKEGDLGFLTRVGGVAIPKILLYLILFGVGELIVMVSFPSGKKVSDWKMLVYIGVGVGVLVGSSLLI